MEWASLLKSSAAVKIAEHKWPQYYVLTVLPSTEIYGHKIGKLLAVIFCILWKYHIILEHISKNGQNLLSMETLMNLRKQKIKFVKKKTF